jgi:hypothetical protein
MLGSTTVEVLIGTLTFLFLMSTASSAIVECVVARLKTRAKMLKGAIDKLLSELHPDTATAAAPERLVLNSIAVNTETPKEGVPAAGAEKKDPSYVPPCVFTASVLGKLPMEATPTGFKLADNAPELMRAFWKAADQKMDAFKKEIECWYNAAMDRLSGEFKRRVHLYLFATGLTIATAINADLIMVVRALAVDPAARARMQEVAKAIPSTPAPSPDAPKEIVDLSSGLESLIGDIGKVVSQADFPPATGPESDASPTVRNRMEKLETRLKSIGESGKAMMARAQDTSKRAKAIAAQSAKDPATSNPTDKPKDDEALADDKQAEAEQAIATLLASGLPLGWSSDARLINAHPFAAFDPATPEKSQVRAASLIPGLGMAGAVLSKLLGLLGTAVAVSFGAPFWFDMLSRVTNLRGTGPKPKR